MRKTGRRCAANCSRLFARHLLLGGPLRLRKKFDGLAAFAPAFQHSTNTNRTLRVQTFTACRRATACHRPSKKRLVCSSRGSVATPCCPRRSLDGPLARACRDSNRHGIFLFLALPLPQPRICAPGCGLSVASPVSLGSYLQKQWPVQ